MDLSWFSNVMCEVQIGTASFVNVQHYFTGVFVALLE